MKKFMTIILAVVMIIGMCCGCGADIYYSDDTTIGEILGATSMSEPAPAEPTPTTSIPTVGSHKTPNIDYPVGYEVGEQVWVVIHSNDQSPAAVRTGIVIAEVGPYVVTAPTDYGSGEDLKDLFENLLIQSECVDQCLDIYPSGDCYRSQTEAKAVVDSKN